MSTATTQNDVREAELSRMMNEYGSQLLRVCYVYLKDAQLAEDAVQDAFLKAYRAMDAYRREGSEKTWLMRIAVNTCRDYLRTSWMRRVDRRFSAEDAPERAVEPVLPDRTVIREVMALPPKYREIILLRFYEGMKVREIADTLHLSTETVKSRIRTAKDKLRPGLEGWYFDEE